jgi:hypothetical protein
MALNIRKGPNYENVYSRKYFNFFCIDGPKLSLNIFLVALLRVACKNRRQYDDPRPHIRHTDLEYRVITYIT